ncbi:MAG: hypothetical protein O6939_02690 [Bacteroidetes bacterium]|nr:hypothetical protein [Bacteroidota bacterium]MCZ6899389.1 hypothetical protein [Bacteroidota bacterium]
MPLLAELTDEQFKQLLDEYFIQSSQRQKLTHDEIKDLAQRLNEKINVPIINETKEEKILIKIVIKIDNFLYDNLPNEFYDLVRSIDRGIDDDEAKRLIKRLSKLANKHIDIPYIPEVFEYIAIRLVIAIIINSARKQWDIGKATQNAGNLNIPDMEDAPDTMLEGMIA